MTDTMLHMRTVWSPDALPLVPPRFRPIYTTLLPIADGIFLVFSLFAVIVGSQVVEDFTLQWFPYAWAATMWVGSVLASIGLVFLQDYVELWGKCVLVIGFVVYGGILGVYVWHGSLSSILTICLVAAAIAALSLRIGDLIGVLARKEAAKHATGPTPVATRE